MLQFHILEKYYNSILKGENYDLPSMEMVLNPSSDVLREMAPIIAEQRERKRKKKLAKKSSPRTSRVSTLRRRAPKKEEI